MTEMLTPISMEEIASWYKGCAFSVDWTSRHFPVWIELLRPQRTWQMNVLEIGSWEGRSALFFLKYCSRCRIVCVDTFAGGKEHHNNPEFAVALPMIEQRFDTNLAPFNSRVEKIKATSSVALAELGVARRRFDLVYIDGSHRARDVYSDGVLAWSLLNRKGIAIFDDYEWDRVADEEERPKLGIDAFLWAFVTQYEVIHRGYQMIVQKI